MSRQRATITYSAPPSFLASEHWKQVLAALQAQLPLRNLHWKSVSRPTIRTIQELDVNLVAADAVRDEHTSQIPQTILERPLLNAYIVVCEVSCAFLPFEYVNSWTYIGHRDVQEYGQETDKGLARYCIATQEPRMAHRPHSPAGYEEHGSQTVPDESFCSGQDQS